MRLRFNSITKQRINKTMGLFDFLFGTKTPSNLDVTAERIWLTTEAKFNGVATDILERSTGQAVAILLVAHFADVLEKLEALAEKSNSDVPIKAVLARDLNADIASGLRLDESKFIDIIVAERHPLPSVDDKVQQFVSHLPCRCRLSYHISLDDPVIKAFAGPQVKELLGKLGMSESESIESDMVSRRIRNAQQKIEGKAVGNHGAVSADEWLERNCSDLRNR